MAWIMTQEHLIREVVEDIVEETNGEFLYHQVSLEVCIAVKDQLVEVIKEETDMSMPPQLDNLELPIGHGHGTFHITRGANILKLTRRETTNTPVDAVNPGLLDWGKFEPTFDELAISSSDLLRTRGGSVTSLVKLSEICTALGLDFPDDAHFVGIGEGQGGFLAYLLTRYEKARAVINYKVPPTTTYMGYMLIELVNANLLHRTKYDHNVTGENDITDSLCHDNINLQVGCYLG